MNSFLRGRRVFRELNVLVALQVQMDPKRIVEDGCIQCQNSFLAGLIHSLCYNHFYFQPDSPNWSKVIIALYNPVKKVPYYLKNVYIKD